MLAPDFTNELLARAGRRQPDDGRSCAALLHLLRAAEAVRDHLRQNIAGQGCTELGFKVLTTLRASPDRLLLPSRIAEQCGILRGTLPDVLARLEACGLIARHRNNTDRRQLLVKLTPRGGKRCDELSAHYIRALLQIARAVTPKSRSNLETTLAEISRRASPPASVENHS
jgi:DNA-binding MarR family transcriptional regulator